MEQHPHDAIIFQQYKEAKAHAAEMEKAATQDCWRNFVTNELNKPNEIGKVYKIMSKMEGKASNPNVGNAIEHEGRILINDKEKANAFNLMYAKVSCKVRNRNIEFCSGRFSQRTRVRGVTREG